MSTTPTIRSSHPRDHEGGSLSRWPRSALASPLSALLVVAAFVAAAWLRRWTVDDAFIVFRVVDHVLSGHGPVLNVGERVEAVTSPLWLFVLVIARLVVPVPVEWLAVVIGMALATAGLAFAMAGAALPASGARGVVVPAGALLWLGLPPAWDFATSGLESGLSTAWLGACCWGLARLATSAPASGHGGASPVRLAVLVGLGPVVRPDLGIFSVVFVLALLLCTDLGRRGRLGVLAAAMAVPAVVEVVRMGYYAALVPNTLLAKEASLSNWSQGWRYLLDFASPYALAVPLIVVAWLLARTMRDDGDRRLRIARLAPVVGGVLYALAVVRGGGDFMHARLLLPALFAVLAPVAVVRVRATADLVAVAVLAGWALLSAVALRAPIIEGPGDGISDQRVFYVEQAGKPNPVTLADFAEYARVTRGARAARMAAEGRRALLVEERIHPLVPSATPTVVYEAGALGLASAAAGEQVYMLDRLGLGDAYAARQLLEARRRPGHDKPLPMSWVWGRYGVLSAVPPEEVSAARAARTAMACAPLRELDEAITQPLTARRFVDNLVAAPRLTMLRFPSAPDAAVAALCRTDERRSEG